VKDEAQLRAMELLKEARMKEDIGIPVVTEQNRTRNHIVKQQVMHDLTGFNSPKKTRKHIAQSPTKHSAIVAEMRAGQPASPMSPKTKSKHVGVHIGFQLNMIVTILRRVVDEHHELSRRIFLRTLRTHNNSIKSVERFVEFIKRKNINALFHSMLDLVEYSMLSTREGSHWTGDERPASPEIRIVPTILPIGDTHPLLKVPLHVYDLGNHMNRYASIGRLTGVLLSIIRIQKLAVLNKLIKGNLSKLYLLQRI
jgi:hypothetical protein